MNNTSGTGTAALGGDLVADRYRLNEVLGSGGMGRVWLAEDELLRRPVAVKEMLGPAADRVEIQLRTVREARAAARLDHPGVVKVFDVLWLDDRAWIVMEYVRSRSLQIALQADGPFEHRAAARIGLRVLAALRAAHTAGVLHLDVKPQNVLLGDDGRVVLSDFGLAVTRDPDGGPEPVVMGSPFYVAPERLTPKVRPSPATDLWSLGATLYAAVEGRSPFVRTDTDASLHAVLHEEPTVMRHPGPLTPVLLDLLAKNRDERPTAPELERRLRQISDGAVPRPRNPSERPARGLARVPAVLPAAPADLVPAMTEPAADAHPAGNRRRKRYVLVGTAAVVLIGAVGTAVALDDQRPGGAVAPRTAAAAAPGAAPTVSTVAPTAGNSCGFGVAAAAVKAASTRVPAGLPRGWVWFRDPTGFSLALPSGWRRSMSGTAVCFTDPAGAGAFTVDSAALVTRKPLDYFRSQEKAAQLPGYHKISMDVLLLRRGGADWEYTWRPDSDTTQHVRRVLLAVTDTRSYLLKWATSDADWARNVKLERQLVTLFDSAA
jgi:hypothetical protein